MGRILTQWANPLGCFFFWACQAKWEWIECGRAWCKSVAYALGLAQQGQRVWIWNQICWWWNYWSRFSSMAMWWFVL